LIDLLATDFIAYLRNKNPAVVFVDAKNVRVEVIRDTKFDIQDRRPEIKQPAGTGSATYNNPQSKEITVIDYEDFLKAQSDEVIKKLDVKKPDFIVFDAPTKSCFIINELSQGNPKNKRTTTIQQMHNAILHFDRVSGIKLFIGQFATKSCVFSCRRKAITTADAFMTIDNYLPKPIELRFQPIQKLGYMLIETTEINM